MGKIFVLIVMVIFHSFIGCKTIDSQAEQNKAIVLAALDAMNNHQYDILDQYFSKDFHRYSQASPDVQISNLDEMVRFVKDWYRAFPDAQMRTRLVVSEDDLVAIWVTFSGTHMAPMGPQDATGKMMESETFGFFRLEKGKIRESWVTWDNVAVLTQLGLFPTSSSQSELKNADPELFT